MIFRFFALASADGWRESLHRFVAIQQHARLGCLFTELGQECRELTTARNQPQDLGIPAVGLLPLLLQAVELTA